MKGNGFSEFWSGVEIIYMFLGWVKNKKNSKNKNP